ncbi:peptide deformylase [Crenobacter luteus]|uniref:Peptide deformylase n=1 Tax=Crenobacter luteus TaxID=1452487 RepID=A0A163DKB5_9NEIS|nr:peptide deformylase [Crenobacter luteus]KZE34846.1 peptide deformylase [Crenobacter luteus]TCP15260.1 peptide deformylase [Crenobacter luteus]
MALLNILHYPDERLHTVAKPISAVDDRIRTLIDDMAETMYEARGIGLAATQVNVHERLVVIDVSEDKSGLTAFVNPEIVERRGDTVYEEGCLSVPGIYDKVHRSEWVRVRALDRDGQPFEIEADGLLAICIQHEIDHLDGKVFVEYLSQLKQDRIRTKLRKREKNTL